MMNVERCMSMANEIMDFGETGLEVDRGVKLAFCNIAGDDFDVGLCIQRLDDWLTKLSVSCVQMEPVSQLTSAR